MLSHAARHPRRRFLVTHADVRDPVLPFAQGFDYRVYAVANNSKHMRCAPVNERFH